MEAQALFTMGYSESSWSGVHFHHTLSIECQVAYASFIVTDDDSTFKDAVSRSMLRLGNSPITCDEASEEVLETSGRIMTLHGLIVDADCINSKLQTELPCSNNWTNINSGSPLRSYLYFSFTFCA